MATKLDGFMNKSAKANSIINNRSKCILPVLTVLSMVSKLKIWHFKIFYQIWPPVGHFKSYNAEIHTCPRYKGYIPINEKQKRFMRNWAL